MTTGGNRTEKAVLDWLLAGDVSIQYQTRRDLLGEDDSGLRARTATDGWGARFLACRKADGSWGQRFYQPKWTSSHYTLLDLRLLEMSPDHPKVRESIAKIVREEKCRDGGVGPARTVRISDICVNGMFLDYASYFGQPESSLRSVIDFLLADHMADGGFNCERNSIGARHSSLHSTIAVLEGFNTYAVNGYSYRLAELAAVAGSAREFILRHRLFKSDRTGEIIHKDMLKFAFPPRWKYNILRALDYFRAARVPWDERMADALGMVLSKRREDGRWTLPAAHPVQTPSRTATFDPISDRGPGRDGCWNDRIFTAPAPSSTICGSCINLHRVILPPMKVRLSIRGCSVGKNDCNQDLPQSRSGGPDIGGGLRDAAH